MNALVTFRANAVGNLVASRAQRQSAASEVRSNLQSRVAGIMRRLAAKSGTGVSSGTEAKAATSNAVSAKSSTGSTTETSEGALDRDAFLQLLVTQMQNQDPLDPVDNGEMVAQLAQFSSLEQMTNLNESFENLSERMEFLVGNVDQLNFISAQALLGRYVTGFNLDGEQIEGVVDSITLDGSIVVLTVNEQYMPMTGVVAVGTEASAADTSGESATDTEK